MKDKTILNRLKKFLNQTDNKKSTLVSTDQPIVRDLIDQLTILLNRYSLDFENKLNLELVIKPELLQILQNYNFWDKISVIKLIDYLLFLTNALTNNKIYLLLDISLKKDESLALIDNSMGYSKEMFNNSESFIDFDPNETAKQFLIWLNTDKLLTTEIKHCSVFNDPSIPRALTVITSTRNNHSVKQFINQVLLLTDGREMLKEVCKYVIDSSRVLLYNADGFNSKYVSFEFRISDFDKYLTQYYKQGKEEVKEFVKKITSVDRYFHLSEYLSM